MLSVRLAMFRQNLLLSLLFVGLMFNAHAQIDPTVQRCIEEGSDDIGKFKKIKSDGQCRQPFKIMFTAERGVNYKIYTEMTTAPIDESIIRYSFGSCKLELKAFNQDGKVWFEPLSDSGKRINPDFYIHLYEPNFAVNGMKVMKKEDDIVYYEKSGCDVFNGFGNGKSMEFKQEIEVGDPNIALILYEGSSYFGKAGVQSSALFGSLPPHLSTTTKTASTTTSMTSSTVSKTTKFGSSSTQNSTSSSSKASSTVATSENAAEEKGMKSWLIGVIVGVLALLLIVIAVIIAVICIVRRRKKKEKPQVVDVVFKTEETMTRETTLGGEAGRSKKKSKESNKSVSKSLFGSMEKA